jgi:AbrB family looped-hinge helix DNA binding protein
MAVVSGQGIESKIFDLSLLLEYPYFNKLKGGTMSAALKPKSDRLELAATVTSKGQITLPVALRERLGIEAGTKIRFIHDAKGTRLEAEKPISAYRGILKHLNLPDDIAVIPKEPDRNFDYVLPSDEPARMRRTAIGPKR